MPNPNCPKLTKNFQELLSLKNDFKIACADFKSSRDLTHEERKEKVEKIKELIAGIKQKAESFDVSFIRFNRLSNWLKNETIKTPEGKTVSLESRLEGGSFEALINEQEKFYQKMYGDPNFKIDRKEIKIEKTRLKRIKAGLENGSANYPLLTAIPENLSADEKQMTEAEFAFHKLLEPLKAEGLEIWKETGDTRWSKLTLIEVLKNYIPVEIEDFDIVKLEANWQAEIKRVINKKKTAPKVHPGKLTLTFTDNRQDIPREQKTINQEGKETENKKTFIGMIKSKVNSLTPDQWISLAAISYAKDKTYLSKNILNWMMAVLKNNPRSSEPVSAAGANSGSVGVCLHSGKASGGNDGCRWRAAL